MQVAGVVWNSLDGCGVADVNVLRVVSRIEGYAEGMVQAGCELFDLRGFAIGPYAAKDEDGSSAGVGEEEIAVGCGSDEARHGESAAAESHHLLVVGALHGGRVAAGIEGDFEAGGRDGPCVGGARNDMGRVVDGLIGLGLGQVGESDLAADAGLLLIPIGERGLAGDGLLRRQRRRKKHGGCDEDDGKWGSHTLTPQV